MKIEEMNQNADCRGVAYGFANCSLDSCDEFWVDMVEALANAADVPVVDPRDAQVDLLDHNGQKYIRVYYNQMDTGCRVRLAATIVRSEFGEFVRKPIGAKRIKVLHEGGLNYGYMM